MILVSRKEEEIRTENEIKDEENEQKIEVAADEAVNKPKEEDCSVDCLRQAVKSANIVSVIKSAHIVSIIKIC